MVYKDAKDILRQQGGGSRGREGSGGACKFLFRGHINVFDYREGLKAALVPLHTVLGYRLFELILHVVVLDRLQLNMRPLWFCCFFCIPYFLPFLLYLPLLVLARVLKSPHVIFHAPFSF